MPEIDIQALRVGLYARRYAAVTVPYFERSLTSGPAREKDCHNNVDRFVLENPDHKPVRGWLVFDFHQPPLWLFPVCRFTSHSVVEGPDGDLFDITPSKASRRYPFLRHEGPEGEFEAIVLAGYGEIDHQVRP